MLAAEMLIYNESFYTAFSHGAQCTPIILEKPRARSAARFIWAVLHKHRDEVLTSLHEESILPKVQGASSRGVAS